LRLPYTKLDGLEQSTGGFALPDLPEAAATEGLDEAIPGNRLSVRLRNQLMDFPLAFERIVEANRRRPWGNSRANCRRDPLFALLCDSS